MDRKISIGSWAYAIGPYESNPVPLDEVAKRLGELKFDGIELGGFKPHAHPDLYPTKADRGKLMDMLAKNGLGVSAYVLDLFRQASRRGTTVVVATHDPLALEAVDRAYFVRDGALHEPDRAELQLWLTEGEGGLATAR